MMLEVVRLSRIPGASPALRLWRQRDVDAAGEAALVAWGYEFRDAVLLPRGEAAEIVGLAREAAIAAVVSHRDAEGWDDIGRAAADAVLAAVDIVPESTPESREKVDTPEEVDGDGE